MVVQNLNLVSSTYGARLWPKPRFSTTSHNLELKLRHDQWLTLAHCLSRVRLSGDSDRIAVERAIAEIRMARPVLIQAGTGSALAAGVEELDPDRCVALDPI